MNKVYVDKARLLRRAIIISWATLALCFLVKIFGGNFFEIMCESPNYKALCEYAESHFWLMFILQFVSSLYCHALYLLAILQKYKFSLKEFIFVFATVLISPLIKYYSNVLGLLYDVWLFIIMPFCMSKFNVKKIFVILVACFLSIAFQFISLIVKNISIGIIDDSAFISLIYMIDVYIMCLLYYLYRNYKKENNDMGAFWGWFAGKPADKLRVMKAKREAKIKKLEAEVNAIEVELSKKKNEK